MGFMASVLRGQQLEQQRHHRDRGQRADHQRRADGPGIGPQHRQIKHHTHRGRNEPISGS